jgi:hypothetical protein
MSDEKLQAYAKEEREFLHDIATPLMIALGHIEHLIDHPGTEDEERIKYRLDKAFSSLKKLSEKLHERRKDLHNISGIKK